MTDRNSNGNKRSVVVQLELMTGKSVRKFRPDIIVYGHTITSVVDCALKIKHLYLSIQKCMKIGPKIDSRLSGAKLGFNQSSR